jgi:uncharacterized protein YndB with AHSA1/START domain
MNSSTPMKQPTSTLKVTTPTDREIRIERVFNAPRERVWRAFTDPKLAAQSSEAATGGTSSTPPTASMVSRGATAR